jgi:hypothetical protein
MSKWPMFSSQMGHFLPITYLCPTSHLQFYNLPTYQPTTHLPKCTPYLSVHPPITYLHINYLPTYQPTHPLKCTTYPPTHLLTYPPNYLHTYYIPTHLPIYLPTHPPTYLPTHPSPTNLHYYNSWFLKRFKLINLSFSLMDMYILTKGQRFEWHRYLLTNQLDYSGSFD